MIKILFSIITLKSQKKKLKEFGKQRNLPRGEFESFTTTVPLCDMPDEETDPWPLPRFNVWLASLGDHSTVTKKVSTTEPTPSLTSSLKAGGGVEPFVFAMRVA